MSADGWRVDGIDVPIGDHTLFTFGRVWRVVG